MSFKQRRNHKTIRQYRKWCKNMLREIHEARISGNLKVSVTNGIITLGWGGKVRVEGARIQRVRVVDNT